MRYFLAFLLFGNLALASGRSPALQWVESDSTKRAKEFAKAETGEGGDVSCVIKAHSKQKVTVDCTGDTYVLIFGGHKEPASFTCRFLYDVQKKASGKEFYAYDEVHSDCQLD